MHEFPIDRDEIVAETIRNSLIDFDFFLQSTSDDWDGNNRKEFERKMKEAKLKMIATDSIIKKVRDGELQVSQIREALQGTSEEKLKPCKQLMRQLEILNKPNGESTSEYDIQMSIEMMDVSEDAKAILLCNKKKELETLRREIRLLIEIIFGKKVTREHNELLRKEYQKIKAYIKSPMMNFNIYM